MKATIKIIGNRKKETWKCEIDSFPILHSTNIFNEINLGVGNIQRIYTRTEKSISPIEIDLLYCFDKKPNILFDFITLYTKNINQIDADINIFDSYLTVEINYNSDYNGLIYKFFNCDITSLCTNYLPGDHARRVVITEKQNNIFKGTICKFTLHPRDFEILN